MPFERLLKHLNAIIPIKRYIVWAKLASFSLLPSHVCNSQTRSCPSHWWRSPFPFCQVICQYLRGRSTFSCPYFSENRSLNQGIETVHSTQSIAALHFPVNHVGGLFLHYLFKMYVIPQRNGTIRAIPSGFILLSLSSTSISNDQLLLTFYQRRESDSKAIPAQFGLASFQWFLEVRNHEPVKSHLPHNQSCL